MINNRSGLPTYRYLEMNKNETIKSNHITLTIYVYRVEPSDAQPLQHRLGEALLKCVLANEGITTYDLRRSKKGKPLIYASEEDSAREICHASISHTSGYVVCAVSPDRPVGVDVERLDGHKLSNVQMRRTEKKLLKKEFEPENDLLKQTPGSQEAVERTRRFYERWTLAEAYGKMKGVGLSFSEGYDTIITCPHETCSIDDAVVTVLAEGKSEECLQAEWVEVRKNDGNFPLDFV